MKFAADFREIARDALRGKWKLAVLVGLAATLLGGVGNRGPELSFQLSEGIVSFEFLGQTLFTLGSEASATARAFRSGSGMILLVGVILALVLFAIGSAIEIGYACFNLNLVDRKPAGFDQLISQFSNWKTTMVARLLRSVYILLWSLLFIIPGIIATYSYAMTGFILAEHPELTAGEAIEASKAMMRGNRWRLFCLRVSFIGWDILTSLTLGIGNLWLTPYRNAADAAFYREISGTEPMAMF